VVFEICGSGGAAKGVTAYVPGSDFGVTFFDIVCCVYIEKGEISL